MPTRFLPPEVPLTLQLPLVDSLLLLEELIEDTTQIQVEPGTGNLALALEGELSPVSLAEPLGRVGEIRHERSFRLQDMEGIQQHLQGWGHAAVELPLSVLAPGLPPPPATVVVPPTAGNVQVDSGIQLPEEILAVSYRQGVLQLVLKNQYPVPVAIEEVPSYGQPGVLLRTAGYGEWFFPLTAEQRTIPPGGRRGTSSDPGGPIQISLAGVVLTRASEILLWLSSPGSGGQGVPYTSESLFRVFLQPQEAVVEWAQIFPSSAWEEEFVLEVPLPQQAELNGGEVRELKVWFMLQNDLPITFRGRYLLPQLRQGGNSVSGNFTVRALSTEREEIVLDGPAALVPEPEDGGAVRVLRIRVRLSVEPPVEPVIVRAEHGVTVQSVVEAFRLGWAWGSRLPIASFEVQTQAEVWLQGNLGLLSHTELELAELIVEAAIENTAAVSFRVEGTIDIADRNGTVMAQLPLAPQVIHAASWQGGVFTKRQSQWQLRYSDIRLTARPRFVRFQWRVEPESSVPWAFADTSRLQGKVRVLIPVRMRVQRLRYEGSWAFTGGEILRRQGQKIEEAVVMVEVRNHFPIAVQVRLRFVDSLSVVSVPPEGYLTFAAAPVTSNGTAEREQYAFQQFVLDERHIPILLQADSLAVELVAWTTAQQYVRIRTSDYAHVRAMARVSLVVP